MSVAPPMLDTYREVTTPEGVTLQLPAAGPVPRALAWLVDLVARMTLLTVASLVFMLLGGLGRGLYLVTMFALMWAYPIVLEARWGQTLGKRVLGLRVVSADGAPVGWTASIVRNLLRTVDMLPFGYAAGLLCCLFDTSSRRLGDLVAGTVVIHQPVPPAAAAPAAGTGAQPPRVALQPHEQAAVLAFAERAPRLSPPRQQELAELAAPLTGQHGPAAVPALHAVANWLLGRR